MSGSLLSDAARSRGITVSDCGAPSGRLASWRMGPHCIKIIGCCPSRRIGVAVIPRLLAASLSSEPDMGIQDVFKLLADSVERSQRIVEDLLLAYRAGRSIIVLTERAEHLDKLEMALTGKIENLFALHGRMPRKQRTALLEALEALPGDAPRVLLATGRLVGEGFDHPPLDTLMLAMPVSWKGT